MKILFVIFLISSMIFGTKSQKRKYECEHTITLDKTEFEQSQTHPHYNNPLKDNEVDNASNPVNLPIMESFNDEEINNNHLLHASSNILETYYESIKSSDKSDFNYNAEDDMPDAYLDETNVKDLFDIDLLNNFNLKPDVITEMLESSFDQSIHENKDLKNTSEDNLTEESNDDESIFFEDLNEIISKEMPIVLSEDTKVTLERRTEENNDENSVADKKFNEIQNDSTSLDADEQNTKKVMDKFDNITLQKHLEIANVNLRGFIKSFLFKKDQKNCLKRIAVIEYIVKLFDKTKITSKIQEFSKILNDNEFEKALRAVLKVFGNNRRFNKRNYFFLTNKILKVMEKFKKSYNLRWKRLSKEDRTLIFCHEFLKLYNYAPQMPEILTLGGILSKQLVSAPTFLIHLINVFIEKVDNLEENKVFIKCLIYKALSYSSKSRNELFLVPKFKIKCDKNHKDLSFFMWEMTGEIQKQIRQLIKKGYFNDPKYTHTIYLKTVLILFLHQHFIFLKFYGLVTVDSIQSFKDFFEKLVYTDECFACIFDEFMVLVRIQVDNIKNK